MDQNQSQRRLSEISHLFLSDVRAKATGNAPLPVRRPPGAFKGDVSIDLTPEEFARVFSEADEPAPALSQGQFKPVRAVVAHHLGELMADRIRDFAGMFCRDGKRVGVIYADAADVRVSCVENNPHAERIEDEPTPEPLEAQRLEEVLVELNQDVDAWLVVLPDPRNAESRELLRHISHWTLISGVDHDGVVSSYRTIKGLCEVARPNLSIAIFGAIDEVELEKTYRKLGSVCDQFLHMKSSLLGAIEPGDDLADHLVLAASASHSKSQLALSPQWAILTDMVLAAEPVPAMPMAAAAVPQAEAPAAPTIKTVMKSVPVDHPKPAAAFTPEQPMRIEPQVTPAPSAVSIPEDGFANIIDLPHADASPAAVIGAVIRGGSELIESPVKAPAHPEAIVAVSRDHQLVLVAAARTGLADLRTIAQAYRWMSENRSLIAMALPQFSIDVHSAGRLHLLVDHADVTADVLQTLMENGSVTVKAYRKLRWAGKTGLLLEAA